MSGKPDSVSYVSQEKELDAVLIGMVGRRLTVGEIIDALELPSTTYYQQRTEKRLITAENLVRAARNLGINEVELLVAFNLIDPHAIEEYTEVRYPGSFTEARRRGVTVAVARPRPATRARLERAQRSPSL